jgi:DeoR/GlpR family transcriptional regulator of sugar metabolism
MLPDERQFRIVEIVNRNGAVEVARLAEELGVSLVTIRRDLDRLADAGLLVRSHGGAVSVRQASTAFDPPYEVKRQVRLAEKRAIGEAAADLVEDGETIVLDSGSTTYQIVPHLSRRRDLTIVTNDLVIALELSRTTSHHIVMLGGAVRTGIFSTWGPHTEQMMAELSVNKAFLAADAVSPARGVMNAILEEVPVKRMMLHAGHRILVVDHSKFLKTALAKVCNLDELDLVLTDDGLPEKVRTEIAMLGVELRLAAVAETPAPLEAAQSGDLTADGGPIAHS